MNMKIKGVVKSSLIDYPGKASAVIFLGGCNFRCGYCHNPDIAEAGACEGEIELPEFLAFLEKRKRFLDGVVISGGEPTLHEDLYPLVRAIKETDYAVKLDTNGTNPDVLRRLVTEGLVDYVAMDIKGPWKLYESIAHRKTNIKAVQESAAFLRGFFGFSSKAGTFGCEFRTTVFQELLREKELRQMTAESGEADAEGRYIGRVPWYLQNYRDSGKRIDKDGIYSAYEREELERLGRALGLEIR